MISYTEYLEEIDVKRHENVSALKITINYWKPGSDVRLRDVVLTIRDDEAGHRDVNPRFADKLKSGTPGIDLLFRIAN